MKRIVELEYCDRRLNTGTKIKTKKVQIQYIHGLILENLLLKHR